jgi:hypothetical protein
MTTTSYIKYFNESGPKVELVDSDAEGAKLLIDGAEIRGVKNIRTNASAGKVFSVTIEILPCSYSAREE